MEGEEISAHPSGLFAYLTSEDPGMERALDEWLKSGREATFREELDEFLGVVSPAQAAEALAKRPIKGRMHIRETVRGVPRFELALGSDSEWLELVPDAVLEEAMAQGRLDFFRTYKGGLKTEFMGEIGALYTFLKTQRLGSPFKEEWQEATSTHHFLRILAAVRDAERQSRPGDGSLTTVRVSSLVEEEELLKSLDATLTGPLGSSVRGAVEAAGLRWRQWCRAGRGWRARWGLEKTYF